MKRSEPESIETIINNYINKFKEPIPKGEDKLQEYCYELGNSCITLATEMGSNLAKVLINKGIMDILYKLLLKDELRLLLHSELYNLIHSMFEEYNQTLDKQEKLLSVVLNEFETLLEITEEMKTEIDLLQSIILILIDFSNFSSDYLATITISPVLIELINMLKPKQEPFIIPITVSKLLVVLTEENPLCVELLTQKMPKYFDILNQMCTSQFPNTLKICYSTILYNVHPIINKTIPIIFPIIQQTIDKQFVIEYEEINNKKLELDTADDLFIYESSNLEKTKMQVEAMKMGLELLTNISTFDDKPNVLVKKYIEESNIILKLIEILQLPMNKSNTLLMGIIETVFGCLNNLFLVFNNEDFTVKKEDGVEINIGEILYPLLLNCIKENINAHNDSFEKSLLNYSLMCYHSLLMIEKKGIDSQYEIITDLFKSYKQKALIDCEKELQTINNLCYITSIIGKHGKISLEMIAEFVKYMMNIKLEESTEIFYDAILNVVVDLFAEEDTNDVLKKTGLFTLIQKQYEPLLRYSLDHLREDDTSLEDIINNIERFIDYKKNQKF